jgi:CRISPR-associated protein Cas2
MALNQIRNWLIAYDIADPRRLQRVHALLRDEAVPVQHSVFAARCSAAKIGAVRMAVADLIARREDDVRFYPVPEPGDGALGGYGERRGAWPAPQPSLRDTHRVEAAAPLDRRRHPVAWAVRRGADGGGSEPMLKSRK